MTPVPTTRPQYRMGQPHYVVTLTRHGHSLTCLVGECEYYVDRLSKADADRLGLRHDTLTHGGRR